MILKLVWLLVWEVILRVSKLWFVRLWLRCCGLWGVIVVMLYCLVLEFIMFWVNWVMWIWNRFFGLICIYCGWLWVWLCIFFMLKRGKVSLVFVNVGLWSVLRLSFMIFFLDYRLNIWVGCFIISWWVILIVLFRLSLFKIISLVRWVVLRCWFILWCVGIE